MDIAGKVIVVTGAASGIGRALAIRFAEEGAKVVVSADRDEAGAKETAQISNGAAFTVDVSKEGEISQLIETVEQEHGPIDLFFSNAGISMRGGVETPNEEWQKIWDINVMSHVWAARYMIPRMVSRGGGYICSTASAAGLLSAIGSAPYAVTKHAAVSLAEWIAITHGHQGIVSSVLCPMYVRTPMTKGLESGVASINGMMEVEEVASACVAAIEKEEFLILPHAETLDYVRNKTADYDAWIGHMSDLHLMYRGNPIQSAE